MIIYIYIDFVIFNIFKSKPTLKELIPEGFVDIHSHILPGIDDGAKDVEESLELMSEMKNMGFSKIIGTPHTYPGIHDNTNESIKSSYLALKEKIDYEICFASEYFLDEYLIDKANSKSILTLDDRHFLFELGFISHPNRLLELIFQIRLLNYIPILAHPERYMYFFNDLETIYKLKTMGCKFQMNLLSATGYYGTEVLKFCNKLLSEGIIDFVGSDIHNINHVNKFDDKLKIKYLKELQSCIENNISYFREI